MTDPYSEIVHELSANEKLLWSGKPGEGLIFRSSDIFMIPFSIFWLGFSLFWMVGASAAIWASNSDKAVPVFAYIFPLFGIPFVAVGLYMAFGRYFVDKVQRKKTFYGVTDERIIIRSGIFSRSVKSLNLRTLSDITLKEKDDGTGTITFGPGHPMFAMFEGMNWWPGMGRYQSPSFDFIPEAKKVFDIIREQQK